jgi:acetyl-CoA carboxylase biotin carboxyl carrier protein
MEWKELYELMDRFDRSEAGYLEVQIGSDSVKLKKPSCMQIPQPAQVPQSAQILQPVQVPSAVPFSTGQQNGIAAAEYAKAPLVGIFYASASPDGEPFVRVGAKVKKGDPLCLIEAMKMMSEVKSEKEGTIQEILVKSGDMVEYDQPLFRIQES